MLCIFFFQNCIAKYVSVVKVRQQVSTRHFKFVFDREDIVISSWASLTCDQLYLTFPGQVLHTVCHQKNAGFVLGADRERFLVGSSECSHYTPHLSLQALLLSVQIGSLSGELNWNPL